MNARASGPPDGVSLREVTEKDLPAFFEHQLDPEAVRMSAFPPRDRDAFVAHWTRILGDESIVKKTVLVDGRVAGNVVSFEAEGEVGYWLGRDFWGKGVAREALSRFLAVEGTRRLRARVATGNVASIRVLEKCGFTLSGTEVERLNARGEEVEMLHLVLRAGAEAARL